MKRLTRTKSEVSYHSFDPRQLQTLLRRHDTEEVSDLQIAVCIPSRGLIMSRTMQDVIAATLGYHINWYFAHGHPIPDSHNIIVEEAMEDENDYIFMVEDDQQLPYDILKGLLEADVDMAVADYPVRKTHHSVTYVGGEFQYAGLGCMLVKREVFERLDKPYFRVDTEYVMSDEGLTPTKAVMGNHGLLDVDFYQRCIELNVEIKVIDKAAGHYNLVKPELPKYGNQTGLDYEVEVWQF